jgi:hypothetical protein
MSFIGIKEEKTMLLVAILVLATYIVAETHWVLTLAKKCAAMRMMPWKF